MAYLARPPVTADARDLGSVHVRAWQAAYRNGLMPDEYLDALSIEERAEMWREALTAEPNPRRHRYVADDGTGTVVGFILVGPAGGEEGAADGEVYAVNVEPDHWGSGAGTLLLDAGVTALAEDGYGDALLWVHPGNERARRFYEARGWAVDDAERSQDVLGVVVPEVRYRRPLR